VLAKALAKNPAERYAEGQAFAQALRQCTRPAENKATPRIQSTQRRPLWILGGILATALLIAAGLAAHTHGRPASTVPALQAPMAEPPRQRPPVPGYAALPGKQVAVETAKAQPAAMPLVLPERTPPPPPPAPVPWTGPTAAVQEESPEERFARAKGLVREDPVQAVFILRSLAGARPGDVQLQGTYLAALYFSKDGAAFDEAFGAAHAAGLKVTDLLKVQAFRTALQEETRLHRSRSLTPVLSPGAYARVLSDLNPEGPRPSGAPPANTQ